MGQALSFFMRNVDIIALALLFAAGVTGSWLAKLWIKRG